MPQISTDFSPNYFRFSVFIIWDGLYGGPWKQIGGGKFLNNTVKVLQESIPGKVIVLSSKQAVVVRDPAFSFGLHRKELLACFSAHAEQQRNEYTYTVH